MKSIKKLDIIIIVILLIISFTPNIIFAKNIKNYANTYVNVKIDGKTYDNIPLSSFKGEKEIKLNSHNIIKIKDGSVQMLEAECPDSLCIKQGTISKVGQTIVCLPHKLIIEIKGDEVIDANHDIILPY